MRSVGAARGDGPGGAGEAMDRYDWMTSAVSVTFPRAVRTVSRRRWRCLGATGRPPRLEPAPVDPDRLVDTRLVRSGTDLGARGISVRRARGQLPAVMADPERLGRVLANPRGERDRRDAGRRDAYGATARHEGVATRHRGRCRWEHIRD